MEITVKPHESFEGRYKWRVRGAGIVQRSGHEASSVEAYEAAEKAIPTLRLVK